MIAVLASAFILQRATLQDVLKAQEAAGLVGLPVKAAEIARFRPSETTKRSHALIKSITSQFKYPSPDTDPNPIQQIDWEKVSSQLKSLATQTEPVTINNPSDIMTGFPGNAASKALLKAVFRKAFDPATSDSMRVELLTSARKLMENPSWDQNLVANLVNRAMQAVYVKGATNFAAANPKWFGNHPELARPFRHPDLRRLLKGEFLQTAFTLCGEYPVTSKTKFQKGYEPRYMIAMFKNWGMLYQAAASSKTFAELDAYLDLTEPKMTKVTYEGEAMTFTFALDMDLAKLDDNLIKWNAELAALPNR